MGMLLRVHTHLHAVKTTTKTFRLRMLLNGISQLGRFHDKPKLQVNFVPKYR